MDGCPGESKFLRRAVRHRCFVRICKRVQVSDRPVQDKIVVVILSVPGPSRYSRFSLTRFMMSSRASGGLAPEKPTFLLRIKKGTPFMFSRLARA